tara:strand:- start:289 stop:942 length:654 start_codon:yes stop_codon:yes gene_type:complete
MSYKLVNPLINTWSQANWQNASDTILFAGLSAQQPFHTMAVQMQDVRDNGADSKFLWGWKRDMYDYLQVHGEQLYDKLMEIKTTKYGKHGVLERDKQMMFELTKVPGLGVVKAGFVMQLMFGRVGCVDVHNLKRLRSVKLTDLSFPKSLRDETKLKKIENYVQICKGNNSSEKLWNKWCEVLTYKQCNRGRFKSGFDVSMFHLTALLGKKRFGGLTG